MKGFEQFEKENNRIVEEIKQLNETEENRLAVITSLFVRENSDMRLKNLQDLKKDISYGAKNYGQNIEDYKGNINEIIKTYIDQTNKFMSAYNEEFLNISKKFKNAEENQKKYFAKIRKILLAKRICELAEKDESEYQELDEQLKLYRRKIGIYERIIMRCDKEFEDCKNRRIQDFNNLFEVKEEQSLVVAKKKNKIIELFRIIKNKFNGYEKFSVYVLQKYLSHINRVKVEIIDICIYDIKKNMRNFDSEINNLLNA